MNLHFFCDIIEMIFGNLCQPYSTRISAAELNHLEKVIDVLKNKISLEEYTTFLKHENEMLNKLCLRKKYREYVYSYEKEYVLLANKADETFSINVLLLNILEIGCLNMKSYLSCYKEKHLNSMICAEVKLIHNVVGIIRDEESETRSIVKDNIARYLNGDCFISFSTYNMSREILTSYYLTWLKLAEQYDITLKWKP